MPEVSVSETKTVVAKMLKLHCKVCDNFTASLIDDKGGMICDQDDGYVPGFMPGNHYGDYLILDIDIETGAITNWPDVKPARLQEWIDAVNNPSDR